MYAETKCSRRFRRRNWRRRRGSVSGRSRRSGVGIRDHRRRRENYCYARQSVLGGRMIFSRRGNYRTFSRHSLCAKRRPMATDEIVEVLLKRGREIFSRPHQTVELSGIPEADVLLNDLKSRPHAFVLACILDRQIVAERAWRIPFELLKRLGSFDFSSLETLSVGEIENAMRIPTPLHRFCPTMSGYLHSAISRIRGSYGGNAAKIWMDRPSSYAVVYRFLEFDGVGVKIASMATNILARSFKIPMADHRAIDISPDRHIQRVFERLGLVPPNTSIDYLLFRARELSPEFPGLLDFPAFEIGRSWCKAGRPLCASCYMKTMCPKAA
jgi:endonuclease III